MLSASQIKRIKSLKIRKFRKENNLFVAEGDRLVRDLMQSNIQIDSIYHLEGWEPNVIKKNIAYQQISKKEMERISGLATPSEVLTLAIIPAHQTRLNYAIDDLILLLDDIQDPGNLGTIIRLADWFGIKNIICTTASADAYAPKVIQATMGSIARVAIAYQETSNIVEEITKKDLPVYGTFLKGENIFHSNLTQNGVIILGNEGKGISKTIENMVTRRLTIPNFSTTRLKSDSLNVALAAAIVCAEFRRRSIVF